MPLRQSGVDLVIKGFSDFISKLGKIQIGYDKSGEAAERLRRRVETTAAAQANAARRVENAERALDNARRAQAIAVTRVTQAEDRKNRELADGKATVDELQRVENSLTNAENNLANATNRVATAQNNLTTAQTNSTLATNNAIQAQQAYQAATTAAAGSTQTLLGGILNLSPAMVSLGQAGIALGAALAIGVLAFKGLQAAINLVGNVISSVWGIIKGFVSGAISLFQGFISFLERITRPLRTFVGHVLEIFAGISLANFVQNAIDGLKELASAAFESVASFQRLEIQLDSLAARDFARATGVPMAEAFTQVQGAAANVFDWMRKLAVTTPFEVGEIARTYAMANAMGLTSAQSKETTNAIINFTSAMGLTDEVMFRIIYNFGQMIQRGKLSGEEFRDLARNFVPIDDIMKSMAERAGTTKEAFRELALEGGVPVEDFLQEFIKLANTDFPDAAKRMARTWTGVTNNIKDFVNAFLGLDILKPVLDRFTGIVADMLDKVLSDETLMRSTKLLGQAILAAFEGLIPSVNAVVEAFKLLFRSFGIFNEEVAVSTNTIDNLGQGTTRVYSLIRALALGIMTFSVLIRKGLDSLSLKIAGFAQSNKTTFADLLKRAWDWGLNFIKSFAEGLAIGIRAVVAVIKTIANLLKTWFGPGSPPQIAPEIDQWGANAMNEFIRGFTLADFSMFNDIASLMQSFIESIGSQLGEANVIPQILQARGGIAAALQAVRSGAISAQQAVSQMVSSIGAAQSEFTNYISALFSVAEAQRQVELASQQVEAAQRRINEITLKYDAILNDLRNQLNEVTQTFDENNRLREIEAAIATGRLTDEERERLEMERRRIEIERQIRAVEGQRDAELSAAELQLQQAQAAQAAAEEQLALAQAQAELAEEQIRLLIEQNDLIQEQIDLLERLKEEAGEVEEALTPEIPDFGAIDELTNLQFDLDTLWLEANRLADELIGNIGELSSIFQTSGLSDAINNVKAAFGEFTDIIGPLTGDDGWLAKIGNAWNRFREFLGVPADMTFIEFAGQKISEFSDKLKKGWDLAGILFEPMGIAVTSLGLAAFTFGKLMLEGFSNIGKAFQILEGEGQKGDNGGIGVLKFITGLAQAPFIVLFNQLGTSFAVFGFLFKKFSELVIEGAKGLKEFFDSFDTLKKLLSGELTTLTPEQGFSLLNLANTIRQILSVSGPLLNVLGGLIEGFVNDAIYRFTHLNDEVVGHSIVPDMMNSMKNIISTKFDEIENDWSDSINAMKDKAGTFSEISDTINTALNTMANVGIPAAVQGLNALGNAFLWASSQGRDLVAQLSTLAGFDMMVNVTANLGAPLPMQAGGMARAGTPYLVGERQPEVFVPNVSGTIIPSISAFLREIEHGLPGSPVNAMPVVITQNIDNSIHVEVNPTYRNVESEASILFDVQAALSAVWR